VLHSRPDVVIETGVAHGVTSRIVQEALNRNGSGHLWSVDLPFPFDHQPRGQIQIQASPLVAFAKSTAIDTV
jgi:cephalosporin hydroxylase